MKPILTSSFGYKYFDITFVEEFLKMETVVKSKPSKKELEKIFATVKAKKEGVDISKYVGKVKAKGNPLILQRKLRDEWK